MRVQGSGPIPARIMLVGEVPTEQDERSSECFSGSAGQELNRMLQEAGIMRSDCYTTNVCKIQPPNNYLPAWMPRTKKEIKAEHKLLRDRYVSKEIVDGYNELLAEIEMVQPNLIIAFGNLAMWTLTGNWGILKWRGSLLTAQIGSGKGLDDAHNFTPPKVIPTLHPAAILREWSMRAIVLNDLRRVKKHMTSRTYEKRPVWDFIVRPSFEKAVSTLDDLYNKIRFGAIEWVEFDLETSITSKHIRCAGLSWSKTQAICIPITDGVADYWSAEEEATVVYKMYKILTHPRVKIRGQNLLFDCQYTHRYWHFVPNVKQDTMIAQHSVFSALPKGLDFLASLYAEHYTNWKMEEK